MAETPAQIKTFPIFGILTIIFVVGKIMGKLTWSWLWVLAPLWAPYAITLVIGLLILAFALGVTIMNAILDR